MFASPARAGTTAGHNFYCQTPQARGYSSFLGYFSPANGYWTHEEEGGTLRDLWRSGPLAGDEGPAVELLNDPHCTADTQVAASAGGRCQYLDELLEAQAHQLLLAHDYSNASSAPLFLFWSPHATHSPVEPPVCRGTRLLNLRTRRVAQPGLPHTHALASPRPVQAAWAAELESWPDEQTCSAKGSYQRRRQALIADLDARVGRVVATLQDRGAPVWERTLLIFASDNGGDFHANNWPLKGGKRTNWEGGVRVAAFVAGGFLPASQRATTNHGLSAGWDWYATLAGLAGVDTHDAKAAAQGLPPVSSHDLWPMLSGRNLTSPRTELPISANTLTVGDWKVITGTQRYNTWSPSTGWPADWQCTDRNASKPGNCTGGCLFNVRDDPNEHHDLARTNPSVLTRMLGRLADMKATVWHNCDPPTVCVPDEPGKDCANAHSQWGDVYGPFL